MNLKRGLSLIAFGFLFTLMNINLTFNGFKINIMPDFVGWLLFFLAFGSLGVFAEGLKWLRWVALVLMVISAAFWALEILKPELVIPTHYGEVAGDPGDGERFRELVDRDIEVELKI